MKALFAKAVWLSMLVACHCSDSKTSSSSANSRVKRQVSDNTGIVNIPDTIAGATPPPTAGPFTPGPTLPPTTASPGFFGPGTFNFPSLFNIGGNAAPGFGSNPFGNFGGGLGGASGNAGGPGGAGGFPTFPSFPTPRPPTNTGGFGPGGFPPINGNAGFPPISGGFPNGGSNNAGGAANPGGGNPNTGAGNTGAGNTGAGNIGGNGFPDFNSFGGTGGNANNPTFPSFPPLNNQPGGNPFNNFPGFSTRAPPTFPSVNLPTTPSSPAFSTNICTPPVFTPLGDRVSNTSLPQEALTAINQELSFNPQLNAFLSFASQINGAPINNANNEDSDLSCPSTRHRATVFQRYGANCWILQDQQQPYYYSTCTCNQCLSPTGFQQPPGSACEPYLQPTAVFAYCENGLNSQNKITQERIALPVTCRCRHAAPSATQTPPANPNPGGFPNGGGPQVVPAATTATPPISGGVAGIPGNTVVVRA